MVGETSLEDAFAGVPPIVETAKGITRGHHESNHGELPTPFLSHETVEVSEHEVP